MSRAVSTPAAGQARAVDQAAEKDPNDPGEGYEWVCRFDFHEETNPARGEITHYAKGQVYEGDLAAEYANPDPMKYGANGPLIGKRKKQQQSDSGQVAENQES